MSEEAQAQERQLIELGLGLVEAARKLGATLRLLGAVAFRVHCPKFKHLEYQVGRFLSDLDFAAYARDLKKLRSCSASRSRLGVGTPSSAARTPGPAAIVA